MLVLKCYFILLFCFISFVAYFSYIINFCGFNFNCIILTFVTHWTNSHGWQSVQQQLLITVYHKSSYHDCRSEVSERLSTKWIKNKDIYSYVHALLKYTTENRHGLAVKNAQGYSQWFLKDGWHFLQNNEKTFYILLSKSTS